MLLGPCKSGVPPHPEILMGGNEEQSFIIISMLMEGIVHCSTKLQGSLFVLLVGPEDLVEGKAGNLWITSLI